MIKILKYIRGYYIYIFLSALACVGVSFSTVMLTDFLKNLVDGNLTNTLWKILIILIIGLCSNYLSVYLTGLIGAKLLNSLRKDSLNSLLMASPDYINNHNRGDILERISENVEELANFVKQYFKDCLYVPIIVIVYSVYLFRINVILASVCLLPLLILVPINVKFMKPIKMMQFEYSKKLGLTNNNIQEAFDGAETIKAYNLQNYISKKYYSVMQNLLNISNRTDFKQYKLEPISRIINELPIDIALIVGGLFVFKGQITIGVLIAYISILRNLVNPLSQCYQLFTRSQMAIVMIKRIFEIIRMPKESDNNNISPIAFNNKSAEFKKDNNEIIIEFKNVCFKYPSDEKFVLNNINFKIKKGSHVAFVGKSGNGKSTILNLIATFLKAYSGNVMLYGKSYAELPPQFIRSKIAYVSQDSILFPMSVEDNIKVGNPNVTNEQLEKAIKQSGCETFKNIVLTEGGSNLSGGQRQRLSIARALIKDADIYLFDEPTSALDSATEYAICQTIANLSKDKTVITVTHKLSTVDGYDYIYNIDNKGGQLCEN